MAKLFLQSYFHLELPKYHVIKAMDGKIKIPKWVASCQRYPQVISSLKQMKNASNVGGDLSNISKVK